MGEADRAGVAGLTRRAIEELRFVVVGAYVADCFVGTPRLPAWDEEREARSIRMSPGGKALNQAVALARLGAQVTAVGAVGDDGLGRDVRDALIREGVDVRWLDVRAGVATTVCLCFVSDEGESAIMWHIDEDVRVMPDNVRAAAPAFADADAALITFETPVPTIAAAIEAASRSGARVFVQPAPALADPTNAKSLPWKLVDVLVPNESEAHALAADRAGTEVLADGLAERLSVGLAVPTIVVTLGERGCSAHADGVTHRYPVEKVTAVDATGGSDAFTATLAAHITAGSSLDEAIGAAQSAAAQSITRSGGHESMPRQT
jgi:ribokinase